MSIPSEQELWRRGITADEWLQEHDKQLIEECIERVDRLMVNTICNPKLKTTEQIDIYLQCIKDAKRVISGKNIIKGEEYDNN